MTIDLPVAHGRLWLLSLAEATEADLLGRAALTSEDLLKFNALKGAARRLEWLGARVLAREQLGGTIGYLPSGRPILCLAERSISADVPQAHISVSHTAEWVALMVASAPCGVDIERLNRDAERVAERIVTRAELELAASFFPANPALLLWCAKEAAYKAKGTEGVDFKMGIRVSEITAQTLKVIIQSHHVGLEFCVLNDLVVVCGIFLTK